MTAVVLKEAEAVLAELGPALPEEYYRELLVARLKRSGQKVQVRPVASIRHRDRVGVQVEAELIVDGALAVAVRQAPLGFSPQLVTDLHSWMKQWGLANAVALDFCTAAVQVRKLHMASPPFPEIPLGEVMSGAPVDVTEQPQASMLCRAVLRVGRGHGLGFSEVIYRGLLQAEFAADGFDCAAEPLVQIKSSAGVLGEASAANCLVVQRACLLLPLAMRENISATDRAVFHQHLKRLGLRWGMIAHFGRRRFEWQWLSRKGSASG